jgi:hypothetical protein
LQLGEHRWVVGTYAMPDVVDAEKVTDDEIPSVSVRRVCQEREQVGDDAIVDSVEIFDVEGIKVMGHLWVERGGKDGEPGVVTHECYLEAGGRGVRKVRYRGGGRTVLFACWSWRMMESSAMDAPPKL